MKRLNNRSNAFTLVEMLVVLGMLSILMAVTFTGVGKARTRAKVVKANAEVRELVNAWLAYEASYDDWPTAMPADGNPVEAGSDTLAELLGGNGSEVFLNAQMVNGKFLDPWGRPYKFRIMKQSGNTASDGFGATVTFPNRHREPLKAN